MKGIMSRLRRPSRWLALGALVGLALAPRPSLAAPKDGPRYRPDTVLVAFHPQARLQARAGALGRLGLQADPKEQSPHFATLRLNPAARAAGRSVEETIAALRRDPAVRLAQPDYILRASAIPNDPSFGELYGLHNTGQRIGGFFGSNGTPDADIDAPEAWDVTTGSGQVVVAVIDTGVDYNHPDLASNILRDNKGAVVGYDFVNNDPDPMDDQDHGTHCAGTIGAVGGDGIGVVGVCPNVKIMPLKFLGADGSGDSSDAIRCIDFAIQNGAHVLSNSYGGDGFDPLFVEAIERARAAGILFVASAGNGGSDGVGDNNDITPQYPANYNQHCDNAISVAATDNNDWLAGFSNYGPRTVDIAAPGVQVLSTTRGNTYSYFSGTSMAAPHVAGAAALLLSRYPQLTLAQLKARLLSGADPVPSLGGKLVHGRLNVFNALEDDWTPPAAPGGFTATHRAAHALRLVWAASGDDGNAGAAYGYELRYSADPITEENFAAAARAAALPRPGAYGAPERYLLTGLRPNAAYYVALRAIDNAGNASPLALAGPFTTGPETSPLDDDVEGALRFRGEGPWAVTTEHSASGTHSYTDSPGGSYANNRNLSLTQDAPTLIDSPGAQLTFRAKTDVEDVYDALFVELSTDNGATWKRLLELTGTSDWRDYTVPLGGYAGQSVKVRFRLWTDTSVVKDGVWLDDIRISGGQVCVVEDTAENLPRFTGDAPWAATTEQSASGTHAYSDSPGDWYDGDQNTALTQDEAVDLSALVPELTFQAKFSLEATDLLHVEVSTDGGETWQEQTPLLSLTGQSGYPAAWNTYTVPLGDHAGPSVKVRFRLVTDQFWNGDGVYLDDIRICGEELVPIEGGPAPE